MTIDVKFKDKTNPRELRCCSLGELRKDDLKELCSLWFDDFIEHLKRKKQRIEHFDRMHLEHLIKVFGSTKGKI